MRKINFTHSTYFVFSICDYHKVKLVLGLVNRMEGATKVKILSSERKLVFIRISFVNILPVLNISIIGKLSQ